MSNFQLIVITHDEKFLEKLGQADVMEYYWYEIDSSLSIHLLTVRL